MQHVNYTWWETEGESEMTSISLHDSCAVCCFMHFTQLSVLNKPHVVLCCVSGTDWKELEFALDRLVSLEKEASKVDSQKGIHNVFQSVSLYVFRVFGMYEFAGGEGGWGESCNSRSRGMGLAVRDCLQLRACEVPI